MDELDQRLGLTLGHTTRYTGLSAVEMAEKVRPEGGGGEWDCGVVRRVFGEAGYCD